MNNQATSVLQSYLIAQLVATVFAKEAEWPEIQATKDLTSLKRLRAFLTTQVLQLEKPRNNWDPSFTTLMTRSCLELNFSLEVLMS
jgi:hypothetical protein